MQEARNLGISKEEVLLFFQKHREVSELHTIND